MPDESGLGAARSVARTLLWFSAALPGAAFFWFAYVDAPLGNLALLLFATAIFCAVVAIIAALLALELSLPQAPAEAAVSAAAWLRSLRLRRVALMFLVVAVVMMLTSATLTLGLQGQADDPSDDAAIST